MCPHLLRCDMGCPRVSPQAYSLLPIYPALGPDNPSLWCIAYHCYANDTQLYLSVKPVDFSNLATLHNCLAAIKD